MTTRIAHISGITLTQIAHISGITLTQIAHISGVFINSEGGIKVLEGANVIYEHRNGLVFDESNLNHFISRCEYDQRLHLLSYTSSKETPSLTTLYNYIPCSEEFYKLFKSYDRLSPITFNMLLDIPF